MTDAPDIRTWTFASGRAAALEARMAPQGQVQKLVQAAGPEEIAQALRGMLIGERGADVQQLQEADTLSRRFYRDMVEDLRRLSPAPHVADLLLVQQELRSLKSHIKRAQLGMDVPTVESRYGEETWSRLWTGLQTDLPPIFDAVIRRARALTGGRMDRPALFDAAFDSASLSALREAADALGNEFVAEYFARYDTVRGVELLWRARVLGLPEEIEQVLAEGRRNMDLFAELRRRDVEDWPELLASAMHGLDVEAVASQEGMARVREFVGAAGRWLMSFLQEGKMVPFGPERVFACMAGLLAEGQNVALAATGRALDIAPGVLAPHVKATYV